MAKLLYDGKNLTLITKATSEVIGITDILYVETDRRKVNIVTDKERYSLIIDIGQLRRVLEIKEEFLSCHKTFVINIKKVKKMRDGEIVFMNNDVRYLGKNNFIAARKRFNEFMQKNHIRLMRESIRVLQSRKSPI